MISKINNNHTPFIQIRLAKTASASINYALKNYSNFSYKALFGKYVYNNKSFDIGHHIPYYHYKQILNYQYNDDIKKYFVFSFVRNPFDRIVSLYENYKRRMIRKKQSIKNFEFWLIDWIKKQPQKENNCFDSTKRVVECLPTGFMGAYKYLSENYLPYPDILNIDFVGKFENLQNDFSRLCKILGLKNISLPWIDKKTTNQHYREYFTSFTKKIIENYFQDDLEYWNYIY